MPLYTTLRNYMYSKLSESLGFILLLWISPKPKQSTEYTFQIGTKNLAGYTDLLSKKSLKRIKPL